MSDATFVIARRFRGPHDDAGATANGGYFCGRVAAAAAGPVAVEIRARAGVPLDRPLVLRARDGALEVHDGPVAIGRTSTDHLPAVTVPASPPLEVALEVSRRFEAALAAGAVPHTFPECFVCGHHRTAGDGMRLFAGPLPGDGGARVAGWQPDPTLLDADGRLRDEFVWSALDCPGGWALAGPGNTGTLQVEIREPIDGRRPLIVMGWPEPGPAGARPGSRRRYAGTAMFDARGRLLAVGAAIWVAPPRSAG
ncbi:MAG TPA: hypothetical protein VFE48_21010 [Methylomirabilota bacterium]|nr:hypothetical protein [Methylomirabilota bacterium]